MLSCAGALTDGRLVVGIMKFDINYTSDPSEEPMTVDGIRQDTVSSIKEATSINVSEDSILPLCSKWALTSRHQACHLSCW